MVAVSVFIIVLSTPLAGLPGLGSLLNPYDGIYEVARLAIHPKRMEVRSDFVSAEVTVLRDNFGIPYIFAETNRDLVYALGYVHAQDRLWQMDMQRRAAEGKLAEVLGKEFVEDDRLMRRIGLGWSAERTVKNMKGTPEIELLEAYCEGVNRRINEGKLPLEFRLLNYKPSPWTPKDTLAIGELITWNLSGTLEPIERQKLAEKLGEENVWEELFPEETPYFEPIHEPPYSYAENSASGDGETYQDGVGKDGLDPRSDGDKDLSLFYKSGSSLGSNNWVVAGENSETGRPILASDPHLSLPLPATWYQVYLKSEEGFGTTGVTFPGIPAIMIGANRNIAWGMTNISADDTDFYTYETDPETGKYLYDGKWLDFEENEITIHVRGSKDVQMVIRRTVHGPVVDELNGRPVAMRWTGHFSWTEMKALFRINKASNLTEFKEGLRYWHCPPQNFVYADKENIALFSNGWYPIREEGAGPGVENGSDPKYDWKGFVPFEEIPHTVNPEEGYLSSANQDPVTESYPYYLGRFFDPGYRGRRIDNLLSSKKLHGIDDFMSYQGDIFSEAAKEIVPILLDVTKGENLGPIVERGLGILSDWNYEMREDEPAPLIWTIWEMELFRNIFDDEYERAGAEGLPLPRPILGEKLLKEEPNSVWFDDVYTAEKENRRDIVVRSMEEAMDLLSEEFGGDVGGWRWGDVNQLYLDHLSGIDALSRGPYPVAGSRATLKVAPPQNFHPDLDKLVDGDRFGFKVVHGPSWRMIVSPGENYFGIYPGGQSGNPLSKHYDDLLAKYLDLEYNELMLPENPQAMDEDMIESRLLILPER